MKSLIYTLTLVLSQSFLVHAAYGSTSVEVPDSKLLKKGTTGRIMGGHHDLDLRKSSFRTSILIAQGSAPHLEYSSAAYSPVPLNDIALNVIKVQKGMTHDVVWQSGILAWEAIYPEGSINPSNEPLGGFGFYLGGADDFFHAISNGAEEIMLSYSVMFEDGFDFNMGGKLPGAFGGVGDEAFGCSGGRQEERSKCFHARLMWRTDGAGEIYTYLPITDANHAAQVAVPGTVISSYFGSSVGRGLFYFPTGKWVTIAERVRLNSVGSTDGLIDLWIDGEQVIKLHGIALREDTNATIQGSHFQTFFGGSSSE